MKRKYILALCFFALFVGACGNSASPGPHGSSAADSPAAESNSTVDAYSLSDEALTLLLIMLRLTESDVAARSPLITIGTD